jgi:hypothetical protein
MVTEKSTRTSIVGKARAKTLAVAVIFVWFLFVWRVLVGSWKMTIDDSGCV